MYTKMKKSVEIPNGVQVSVDGIKIKVKGPKGELERVFPPQLIAIESKGNKVTVSDKFTNAKTRALIGTFIAHINNMMQGVQKEFVYKLKICSVHFPMSVKVVDNELQVTNFLGEKKPRKVRLPQNVNVSVDNDVIIVSATDKELAGMTAAKIEQITRLSKRDRRIFQDGIFITEKAGKVIK